MKRIADQLGIIGFFFASNRRRIARINLDIALGDEKSGGEKDRFIIASFQNLIFIFFESIWFSRNINKTNWKELIDVEGVDLIKQASKRGRGIICPATHFGNWEIIGILVGFLDILPTHSVARQQNNPLINHYIANFRTSTGSNIIYKNNAMTKILSALKKNESVGIVFDQNTIENNVFVDFFGVPAATTKAVATFALVTGAALIPATCYPLPGLRYRVVFGPELEYKITGKRKEDILRITRQCVLFTEGYIKKYPQFYLWGHRRYKTRPPGEPKVY